ncbi:hypothetical protein [Kitasatospora sp. GP82]|uniref:hypothetical protein n=1 Tax=Kitasatospora sp. GP82 TaxID=3035089 RepID=UPI002475AE95|nr:hypothetical protein [Kitasatospora sp. GP82]MDH6124009.1 hypothetical protein [Kitasatospora sp. GP82]
MYSVRGRLSGGAFMLSAPPVTYFERGDVRDALSGALVMLTPRQRALLGLLADGERPWSVEEAVTLSGRSPQECLRVVHELLSRGLIRAVPGRDGVRFSVLNLFRVLCREDRDRWLLVPGTRSEPLPALEALAG